MILVSIASCLFLGFSEYFDEKIKITAFVCLIIVNVTHIILFFLAGFSDPGIMKRNENSFGCHDTFIKVVHKGVFKKTRLCETCNIAKPFRSAHCSECDNCVLSEKITAHSNTFVFQLSNVRTNIVSFSREFN